MRQLPLTGLVSMLLVLSSPALAQDSTAQRLAAAAELAGNALVMVQCQYKADTGKTTMSGIGVCYDADKGDFFTLAFGAKFRPELIEELTVILPGPEQRRMPAEFLGLRPELGIGFVRVKGKHPWQAVRFAESSQVKMGQLVVSMGLMPGDVSNTPYVGVGYVSAILRVPERLCYITGGRLTCTGSPVLDEDGVAIGMVAQTIYMDYQMPTRTGPTSLSLKGRQEAAFFLPVEEFAFVLKSIPQDGSIPRPAWMGVLKVQGVSKDQGEFMKLDRPAVTIGRVIPGGPADKAGLTDGDVIVAIDGQPIERLGNVDLAGRYVLKRIMLMQPGRQVNLDLWKAGAVKQVSLTLTEMPLLPDEAPRYLNEVLGLAVREQVPLDKHTTQTGVAQTAGLIVLSVLQRKPAADGGLQAGDVITAVNGQPVTSVETIKQIFADSLADEPDKNIVLMVQRGSQPPLAISVRPPRQPGSR